MADRINVYTCEKCHRFTVTIDIDEGVTPFMIGCMNDETDCHGTAYSSFYPQGPKPKHIPDPQFEWYRPTEQEQTKMSPAMLEYTLNGGLSIRRRKV